MSHARDGLGAQPRRTSFHLLGVMKDDAERIAMAGAQPADTVSHVDAIRTARASHRTMMHGEDNSIALPKRNHLRPRLHAWTLFGKHKFPAGKILLLLR